MTDWNDSYHADERRHAHETRHGPHRRDEDGWGRAGRRARRYFARRPAESWAFFAAGVLLGGLLF